MPTAFITGANRGIGRELCRQYAAAGWRVHAASRAPQDCAIIAGDVIAHRLDLCDQAEIAALKTSLGGQPLDLIINNAGLWFPDVETLDTISIASWEHYVRVHALAPLLVVQTLADSLRAGNAKIANISSRSASSTLSDDKGYGYGSSKAGLSAITKSLSVDFAARGVVVLALTPGWVRTDMGGPDANLSVEQSVTGLRKVIDEAGTEQSGRFFAYDGEEVPW